MGIRNWKRDLLLLAGAVSLALSVVVQAASAASDPVADEQLFVDAINRTRTDLGLPPLKVQPILVDVARNWSDSMRKVSVASGTNDCLISHNPNLKNAVDADWRKLGENVGCGDVGVDGLHDAFVKSPKHYANIVDPQFDSIGIGIVYNDDVMFVTEQFMDLVEPTAKGTPAELALKAPVSKSKVLSASPVTAPKTTTSKNKPKTKPTTKKRR